MQRVDQLAFQLAAEHTAAPFTRLSAQVCDVHGGQPRAQKPLGERKHRIFSLFCPVIRLDRRGRGTQNQQRALLRDAVLGHVARVVARRLLGFIRAVLLLVDNQHAKVLHGRKHCRTRTDHDTRTAGFDLFEAVIPLPGGQRGVQHSHRVAKARGELPQHLRRQPDFGHQRDCALALLERVRDQLQIYLRLAAAGHTEQQRRTRRIFIHQSGKAVVYLLLRGAQHWGRHGRHVGKVGRAQTFLLPRAQHALFHHVAQRSVRHAGHVDKFLLAHPAAVRQHRDHVHARGAAAADARHRLARLHIKREHLLGLVGRLLHGVAVIGQHTFARERIQHAGDAPAAQPLPDIGQSKRLPRLVEQCKHAPGIPVPLPQRGKVDVRREGIGFVAFEPQSCGQQHAHAVEIGAVQPLAHPRGEFELPWREHRRIVQHLDDRLELHPACVLPEREDDAFRPFIAKAERHENTGADQHLFPQLVRHTVGVQLVDGVGRRVHGDRANLFRQPLYSFLL